MQALLITLTTASLTAILHSIGMENHLYWTYWWFDILTHTLGGFTLGMLIAVLCSKTKKSPIVITGLLLFLVISWEVFEVLFVGVKMKGVEYAIETTLDILIGLVGAYSAVSLYRARSTAN